MADQNVANFMEITGCQDAAEAKQCLKACENHLERGINHYFSRKSRKRANYEDMQPGPSSSKQVDTDGRRHPYSTRKNGAAREVDVSTIDLSDDEMEKPVSNGVYQDSTVRAPIQPVQGPIVQQSFQESYGRNTRRGQTSSVFQQFNDFRQLAGEQDAELLAKTRNGGKQHNAQLEVEEIYAQQGPFKQKNDREVQVVETRSLSSLFRPPVDLMYQGNWDNALLEAKQRCLWLLVNVQKADEFACQVLNRDVWSAPIVKEVINSNFLLWQVYYDSSHGARVRAYYSVNQFPAIFVVDPRIGEEVQKLRATDAVSFLDQVTAFLEKYPSFEARDALLGVVSEKSSSANKAHSSTTSSTSSKKNGKRKAGTSQICSEDEGEGDESTANFQAKRMRKVVNINDDDDEDTMEQPLFPPSPNNNNEEEKEEEVGPDQWKSMLGEPTEHSTPVKLLIKMADGQKESISVHSTTKLETLFAFIAGRKLKPQNHWLVLNFPKRVFSVKDQNKSLKDAGFSEQEVVHIEKI